MNQLETSAHGHLSRWTVLKPEVLTWFADEVVWAEKHFATCENKAKIIYDTLLKFFTVRDLTRAWFIGLKNSDLWTIMSEDCMLKKGKESQLTVSVQEGRREEAVVHEGGKWNYPDHVVHLEGQTNKGLRTQLLSNNYNRCSL